VATIAEVARKAGVGVATVSRVLNGSPAVRKQTRQRVLDAIADLGYAPNAAARALSTGRTLSVGVIAPFFTRPSVMERLRGVSHVLASAGYQLVLFDIERPGQDSQSFRTLPGGLDGVLSISLCPPDADLARFEAAGTPVVLVDHPHEHLPSIHTDDVAGGRMATEHLLALGHRRIAFVGDSTQDPFGFTSSRDRESGLAEELARAGVTIRPDWIGHGAHGRYEARDLAHRMLASPDRPTAVFAASDTQALGVIAAATEMVRDLPDDLSVIGYDDIEAADYVGLTTVSQQLFESGRLGAELLLSQIRDRTDQPPVVRLTPELVVRATTARSKEGRG